MHQHFVGDRPDDRCWADLPPDHVSGREVCNRTNILGLLGLCPNHRFELTGRGIFDTDDVDEADSAVDVFGYAVEVARLALEAA